MTLTFSIQQGFNNKSGLKASWEYLSASLTSSDYHTCFVSNDVGRSSFIPKVTI